MAAEMRAKKAMRCPECQGTIVPNSAIVRAKRGLVHRGCSTAPLLRRPALARVPSPAWAVPLIFIIGILGLIGSTQLAAQRAIVTFGPTAALQMGIPRPLFANFRDPVKVAGGTVHMVWICDGPRFAPTASKPGPRVPAIPFSGVTSTRWGGNCQSQTTAAIHQRILLPVALAIVMTIFGMLIAWIASLIVRNGRTQPLGPPRIPRVPDLLNPAFHLFLGRASGRFSALGHRTGITRTSPVVLTGDDAAQNIVIFGGIGSGKALDCETPVLTPIGYRRLGNVKVGDLVIGRNGQPTRVQGVYPQGVKRAFTVTFNDSTSAVCCEEHLWNVTRVTGGAFRPRVMSLREICTTIKRAQNRIVYAIPTVDPLAFEARAVPVDPYLLGLLLTQPIESHAMRERAIWPAARPTLIEPQIANPVAVGLRSLGLTGTANQAFIPADYKFTDIASRTALLQGLLDTNGAATRPGVIELTTISAKLAMDVIFLVQSFGGTAWIKARSKRFTYNGVVKTLQIAYCVEVNLPASVKPFRKAEKLATFTPLETPVSRTIASVSAAEPREMVCISVDAPDSLFVIDGAIVTHNTVYAINRFVKQALQQDAGVLIFDVKGDYNKTVTALAGDTARPITRIGIGGKPCNLLAGLTPETAASFIKSAILLAGNTGGNSAFWTNTATELVTATLGLLQYFPPRYSLKGLYEAIYTSKGRKSLTLDVAALVAQLELEASAGGARGMDASDEITRINTYRQYIEVDFINFEENVQNGARSQLSQVIRIFSLPEIDRAFCQAGDDVLSMAEVLDGGVFVLDLPLAKYGLGAKTVYTLVKLRFFNVVERRRVEETWNQDRPVVFVCDEYQELISVSKDGLSDRNFWDKSRSSRCVGIISAQGFESFTAAIGDLNLTRALLQNFRQKIAFRTEDESTVRFFSYVVGDAEVERDQLSSNTSSSKTGSGWSRSKGINRSASVREESIINPQTFRCLDRGQAICILSIDGAAYDDIVQMPPEFVKTSKTPKLKPQVRPFTWARFLRAIRTTTTAQR